MAYGDYAYYMARLRAKQMVKRKKTVSPNRYYAVRIADIIEIRRSVKPLQLLVSTLTIPKKPDSPRYDIYGDPIKNTVLKQHFYKGGTVLGVCNSRKFFAKTKISSLNLTIKGAIKLNLAQKRLAMEVAIRYNN